MDLLVLECDHRKLDADGLVVGDAAAISAEIVALLSSGARTRSKEFTVEVLPIDRKEDLLGGLARIVEEWGGARSVLVVAHSNEHGVRLARDYPVSWGAAGRWLAELRPTHVALLACKAGGRAAVSELASGIPMVREIIASPAAATRPLVIYLAGWLAARARRRRISPEATFGAQALLALVGHNVVFHWTPRELRETRWENILAGVLLEEGARSFVDALRRGGRR